MTSTTTKTKRVAKAAPVCTFRVYPGPSRTLYYVVHVWPTRRAMHAHLRHRVDDLRWTEAVCTSWTRERIGVDGRRKVSRDCGEVNFYKGRLEPKLIAHELLHAALGWARRLKIDVDAPPANGDVSPDEERLCYALGRMVERCAGQLKKRGL